MTIIILKSIVVLQMHHQGGIFMMNLATALTGNISKLYVKYKKREHMLSHRKYSEKRLRFPDRRKFYTTL